MSQQTREPEANVLRRSVNDSVLKLDALSTGVPLDYLNLGYLRIFPQMKGYNVVCELQNAYLYDVVVLQKAFRAPIWIDFAQFWCNFT